MSPDRVETEIGPLPKEWRVEKLQSCLTAAPDYGINAAASQYSDRYPAYIRITDISEDGRFAPDSPVSVRHPLASEFFLREGDLVFARTGASVGKCYRYDSKDGRLVFAGFLIRVTPNPDRLLPQFLSAYARTHQYWKWVRLMSMRSGQPGINGVEYGQLPIPVPPLAEQRAIAAALGDVDALLASLDKLIAKKRDLKQAAMQQLLTGKTRLPGYRQDWTDTTLGAIGECVIGLTYRPQDVAERGLLVLRSSNIQGSRLAYDDNVFVRVGVPERLITRAGDILVCVRNGSRALIGKCALIDAEAAGHSFGAFMTVYRTRFSKFVFQVLQSFEVQRQIRDNIGATINQITNKDMRALRLSLPPIDEQNAIAEVLTDMDAEVAALEARRHKTHAIKQGMMQELLTGRTRLV